MKRKIQLIFIWVSAMNILSSAISNITLNSAMTVTIFPIGVTVSK